MPSGAGENVPTASSVSASGPPAANRRTPLVRSPCPAMAAGPLPLPIHSMPTRFTPKSSRATRPNRTVSVSRSTALPARPSTAIVGGSSSRAATLTTSGLPPESPRLSCHAIVTSRDLSTSSGSVEIVAPAGSTRSPSIVAAASSRFAVAVTTAVLPFTSGSTPPRTSFVSGSRRPRYSGSCTLAAIALISGRKVGASFTCWRASPTASRNGASVTCGGSESR